MATRTALSKCIITPRLGERAVSSLTKQQQFKRSCFHATPGYDSKLEFLSCLNKKGT